MPLLATNNHRFGVVVSGTPALPNEFFNRFCEDCEPDVRADREA
jgi:hypothetical protein